MTSPEQKDRGTPSAALPSDEPVVLLAQQGDSEALDLLLENYKHAVRSRARGYFLMGADHEDIVQEGMIGLFKAIRDYRPDRQSSFRAFADLCIKRQIITAIKMATRQKHIPLNSYVSLDKPVYEEESERTLMDVLEGQVTNPEDLVIHQEQYRTIQNMMERQLSGLERQVLGAYLNGQSYQEIAHALGRRTKAIDNALQRIKKKLAKAMQGEES